jgi:hypothetical protein
VDVEIAINRAGARELELKLREQGLTLGHMIQDALDDVALFAEGEAKSHAPRKTGNLVRNIGRDRAEMTRPHHYSAAVGVARTAPYGIWVHEGTGLFGRMRRPIRPLVGNVLAFDVMGRSVFARSVKGQRANPFMREAYRVTRDTYLPARMKRLAEEVGGV